MRISLAEEIREISQVAPKDFDPEELHFEPEDQAKAQSIPPDLLLELGCVCFFSFRFVLIFLPSVIVVLPLSARLRTAYRIRNTLESVCRGHSCSMTLTSNRFHLIPRSRTLSRMIRVKRPRRLNQIPLNLALSRVSPKR
jgi:hypothetical protein